MKKNAFQMSHRHLIVDDNLYVPKQARIVEIREMSETEKFFVLDMMDGSTISSKHEFVMVCIPNIGDAPISICSRSIESSRFEILVRRIARPGCSNVSSPFLNTLTQALHRKKVGDIIGIRGPYGSIFPLEDHVGKDVFVIVGGLGMAPGRRPILDIIANRQDYGSVSVLYGTKTPRDFLFADEFQSWNNAGINVLRAVEEVGKEEWNETIGFGTELYGDLPSELRPKHTVAYIVGPPGMYKPNYTILEAMGVDPSCIYIAIERRMTCAVGKCGQCMVNGIKTCVVFPVLSLQFIRDNNLWEAI